jgi:uncharacterized membrane protein
VVQGLFRDRFNKRVMGVVLGTFTYCLVVLRSVHGNVEDGPASVVPTISVTVAVLLGIATVLAIVGFIDHNAHRMDVSEILQDVTDATKAKVSTQWAERGVDPGPRPLPPDVPDGGGAAVHADRDGWLQTFDADAILGELPVGGTARLEAAPGRYVVQGTVLVSVWPSDDLDDDTCQSIARAVVIGDSRTLTQDPAYGIRQLVDVALRALSPGVNDPTTAQDSIFHLAAVLHAMLGREVPDRTRLGHDGRRLIIPHLPAHTDLLDLAFGELRLAAAPHPLVCSYLLEAIRLSGEGLDPASRRDAALLEQLDHHATLVLETFEAGDHPAWERKRVRGDFDQRFPRLAHPGDGTRPSADGDPGGVAAQRASTPGGPSDGRVASGPLPGR